MFRYAALSGCGMLPALSRGSPVCSSSQLILSEKKELYL